MFVERMLPGIVEIYFLIFKLLGFYSIGEFSYDFLDLGLIDR